VGANSKALNVGWGRRSKEMNAHLRIWEGLDIRFMNTSNAGSQNAQIQHLEINQLLDH
jgi:hypothetical protein